MRRLAILVQQSKRLTERDFAKFHPSGTLGKRLLLSVGEVMIQGDALPVVSIAARFPDLVYEISSKGIGMAIVTMPLASMWALSPMRTFAACCCAANP